MATDSLRALLLELAGYQTNIFEFVDGQHTAKNVMITAIRRENDLSVDSRNEVLKQIEDLKSTFNVREQRLYNFIRQHRPYLLT
jgi:hypothetical protein